GVALGTRSDGARALVADGSARVRHPAAAGGGAGVSTTPDGIPAPAGRGVTVALTCWNAAWCIERALDSVVAQTQPPDEVIVTDDGSTDDTVERIRTRYGDRVRVLCLPH